MGASWTALERHQKGFQKAESALKETKQQEIQAELVLACLMPRSIKFNKRARAETSWRAMHKKSQMRSIEEDTVFLKRAAQV